MSPITILAILAILAGATLSITGFSVISSVVAQTTDGSNTTGSISSTAPPVGNTTGSISSTAPPVGNTTGSISHSGGLGGGQSDQSAGDPNGEGGGG
jgi:hypothetical protein